MTPFAWTKSAFGNFLIEDAAGQKHFFTISEVEYIPSRDSSVVTRYLLKDSAGRNYIYTPTRHSDANVYQLDADNQWKHIGGSGPQNTGDDDNPSGQWYDHGNGVIDQEPGGIPVNNPYSTQSNLDMSTEPTPALAPSWAGETDEYGHPIYFDSNNPFDYGNGPGWVTNTKVTDTGNGIVDNFGHPVTYDPTNPFDSGDGAGWVPNMKVTVTTNGTFDQFGHPVTYDPNNPFDSGNGPGWVPAGTTPPPEDIGLPGSTMNADGSYSPPPLAKDPPKHGVFEKSPFYGKPALGALAVVGAAYGIYQWAQNGMKFDLSSLMTLYTSFQSMVAGLQGLFGSAPILGMNPFIAAAVIIVILILLALFGKGRKDRAGSAGGNALGDLNDTTKQAWFTGLPSLAAAIGGLALAANFSFGPTAPSEQNLTMHNVTTPPGTYQFTQGNVDYVATVQTVRDGNGKVVQDRIDGKLVTRTAVRFEKVNAYSGTSPYVIGNDPREYKAFLTPNGQQASPEAIAALIRQDPKRIKEIYSANTVQGRNAALYNTAFANHKVTPAAQ